MIKRERSSVRPWRAACEAAERAGDIDAAALVSEEAAAGAYTRYHFRLT